MTRRSLAGVVLVLVAAVGCTGPGGPVSSPGSLSASASATAASPTPPPTPTPSQTWSVDQQAAVAALGRFNDVEDAIAMSPGDYSKAQMLTELARVSGGEVPNALVGGLLNMKTKGYRRAAPTGTAWLKASKVVDNHNERGLQVFVTVCRDQRAARVVDKAGVEVPEYQKEVPPYLLRQYSVRKPKGATVWRVYGLEVVPGVCP